MIKIQNTNKSKPTKYYCYVDETGQDTKGKLFIVAIVIVADKREELIKRIEQVELSSQKYLRKWQKSKKRERLVYIDAVLAIIKNFGELYFVKYDDGVGTQYLPLMTFAIAKTLLDTPINRSNISYNIIVDALVKKQRLLLGVDLRKLGISIAKVRGKRDESDAILRLADALAGFVRDAKENDTESMNILRRAIKNKLIVEVK